MVMSDARVVVGVKVKHVSLGVTWPGFISPPYHRPKEKILISLLTWIQWPNGGSYLLYKMAAIILTLQSSAQSLVHSIPPQEESLLWWWPLTPLSL